MDCNADIGVTQILLEQVYLIWKYCLFGLDKEMYSLPRVLFSVLMFMKKYSGISPKMLRD